MTIALLSIGTELTRGELVDTNSKWLAEQLVELGYEVTEMVTVDDDIARISTTLARLSTSHGIVIATGGLGPTTDDLTTLAVASLLEVPLVRDDASFDEIRRRLEARGRAMAASNAKQADFPEGASVLANETGTAPGFSVPIGSMLSFFLPGVPSEMQEMFLAQVVPRLPGTDGVRKAVRLRCFGLPESEINDRLAGLEAAHDIVLGYRASFPEIEVKILASGKRDEEVSARCEAAEEIIRQRLGAAVVYGTGPMTLAGAVGQLLAERGFTFGLAESCTGGLVSELVTNVPGSSGYYVGGVCCYANQVKNAVLGVGADTLGDHGAVSEPVARQMAEGTCRVLGCDVALAITGIAGPAGGTPEKPVGLVHWAVKTPRRTVAKSKVFPGTRVQVQRLAAFAGLAMVRAELLNRD